MIAAFALVGCADPVVDPTPPAATSGAIASGAASTTGSAPAPATSAPPVHAFPSAVPVGPTHYAATTPPAANAACAPLPKGGSPDATKIATAVRRLGCEPALYFMTAAALRAELALPREDTVEVSGPSSVTVRFPKMPAGELAKGFGVTAPVALRASAGAWSWRNWSLAASPTSSETLELWSPGRVYVAVAVDGDPPDDVKFKPLDDTMEVSSVTVSMPEEVLPIVDDALAVAMLLAGLDAIAADATSLKEEPAEVAKRAHLDDERFRVSRRQSGTGPDAVRGVDVWTARTRVAAGPVIEGMGLAGKIEHNRAHDSDDYLLYVDKKSDLRWRGLEVELRFSRRRGAAASGPHGEYELDGVMLMP